MPNCWHLQMIKIEKTRTQIWPSVQLTLSSHWTVPTHHIWKQRQQSEKKKKQRQNTEHIWLWINLFQMSYEDTPKSRAVLSAKLWEYSENYTPFKSSVQTTFFQLDTKFNELLPFGQSSSILQCPFCIQSAAIYTPNMSRSQRFTT